jgi:NAD-dependent DNA ligase
MAGSNCFEETIGVRKLEPVVSRFPNLLTEDITEEELSQVQGCKEKTCKRIMEGIIKFRKMWKELSKYYTPPAVNTESEVDSEAEYSGKTYVFSDTRDKELEQKIIRGGGKISNAVSSKTTALVVRSLDSEVGKVVKAKKLGVPIILYSSFN